MKIIIAGAGEVGYHLAEMLSKESQDITIIDLDEEKLNYAHNHLDVLTVKGSATSVKTLLEAGARKADLFVALSQSEEVNLASAIMSKKLGTKKTIARVNNPEFISYKEYFDIKDLGIDEVFSPEVMVANELSRLLKDSSLTDTFEFDGGKLKLFGIVLFEKSPIIGKTLLESAYLNPDQSFIIVAIHRNGKSIIPKGEMRFELGDHVYFISKEKESGNNVASILSGKERAVIKNIMILGGSRTAVSVAKRLSSKYDIKLIEGEKDKCFQLADELKNVLVLNGDVRDVEFLEEEGISNTDALISITGNSETNIISCLVAKNHGVKKTIALVENIDYINLSMNIGIDTMVNKKIIAANEIFKHIRQGDVISIAGLHGVNAEVVEFEVKPNSQVCNKKISDIGFPKSAIIGGVIRDKESYIPMGQFVLQEKDHVVVFSMPECIRKVEELFR